MTVPQWALARIREARDRNQDTLNLRRIDGYPLTEIPHDLFYPYKWRKLALGNNSLVNLPESITQLQNLTTLDLSDNQLIELPWVVTRLETLRTLDLEGNRLSNLPETILNLRDLMLLLLRKNNFASLPDVITGLQNLTTLNLGENKLGSLPESIGKLQNLERLDLDRNQLSDLPKSINNLQKLAILNLSRNEFSDLPDVITELQNLTILNLEENKLTSLPASIDKLQNLTELDLGSNAFMTLSEDVAGLQNLTKLNLRKNKITSLPDSLAELQKLTSLNLQGNQLTSFPESLTTLQNLTTLILKSNPLTRLPESIGNLHHLAVLDLSNNTTPFSIKSSLVKPVSSYLKMRTAIWPKKENKEFSDVQFTQLPESIGDLKNLKSLNVSNNQLTSLPKSIIQLENLIGLDLTGNPLITPPPEVADKGFEAIREYFRQLEEQGQDQLYEAKLLILGEAGAGKTTLSKKIVDPNYVLQNEESTLGVEVTTWSFPLEEGRSFRVNIWDFGGQEIYHATHQFFLTKRSLYTLVADTRKEDTDFYYWLNVVDLLSDNSPLLIIKNEKQDRHRELNERQLRGEFENLKEVLAVNFDTNRGLDKLRSEIEHYFKNLPHIGSPLPKTWVRVRERLENDYRNYISLEEYLDISKKNGFTQTKDSLQLSEYLHYIGVFLHFQDDALLNKTVILKPKWGTDAVYKVLDNKKVIQNLGKFTRADLALIWHAPEYEFMYNELLQLMMKFNLCYEVPSQAGVYIAPQLLTENQPYYEWDKEDNLLLRYTYEFMPKGILLQFIVVMSENIWKQNVWKSGVVVEKDKTRAEVVEYYAKRQIHIRVSGAHKKELITIIDHELDQIHAKFKRLKYDKLIPCNCSECKVSEEPHFYHLERLQKFQEDRQDKIQCQQSYQMVSVRGLIDDIRGWKSEKDIEEIMTKHKKSSSDSITVGDNFSGTIITGTVKNSFNKIESSDAPNELKETLKQLVQAVDEMNKKLPSEQSKKAEIYCL